MIINNIFSIFDPSSSSYSLSWSVAILSFLFLKKEHINKNSNNNNIFNNLFAFISNETFQLIQNNLNTTSPLFMVLFTVTLFINFIAIFPFNFTPTAHISISLTLTVTIWTTTIMFGWVNYLNSMIIHLTPLGTPSALINFIVLIEIVSSVIRPITLSIRLSANIVAGHLLMTLLSNFSISSHTLTTLSFIPIITLISLEIGVALVQSYVIITLLLLYQNETS